MPSAGLRAPKRRAHHDPHGCRAQPGVRHQHHSLGHGTATGTGNPEHCRNFGHRHPLLRHREEKPSGRTEPGGAGQGRAGATPPGLTLVVLDQLLQRVEAAPWGDVEAAAVQRPDLVMLHAASLQGVPIPHRQGVAACSGKGMGQCPPRLLDTREGSQHRPAEPLEQLCPLLSTATPSPPAWGRAEPQTPKAASEGPGASLDPGSCPAAKQSPLGGPEPLTHADLHKGSPPRVVLTLWGHSRYLWWSRCPVS